MFAALKKNLKLRHLALAAFTLVTSLSSSVGYAQMSAQILQPVIAAYPADINDPASAMRTLGNLPPGTLISMPNPYPILNSQNSLDLTLSLEAWMRSIGANPYPTGNDLAYIPVNVGNTVPGFTAGQNVFVPMNQLIAPGYVRVIDDRDDYDREVRASSDDRTEGRYCTECDQDRAMTNVDPAVREMQRITSQALAPSTASANLRFTPVPILRAQRGLSPKCDNLMNESTGEIGAWGKVIVDGILNDRNRSQYLKNGALGGFCPKFNQLDQEGKLRAWVWFWTALAQEESSCEPKKSHGLDVNPHRGWGIWTMEYNRATRAHRGPECSDIGGESASELANLRAQVTCSLSIMRKHQLEDGQSAYQDAGSYWGPTRPQWRWKNPRTGKYHTMGAQVQMMPHMRRFSECF